MSSVTKINVGDVFMLRQGGVYKASKIETTRDGKVVVDCHQIGVDSAGWHRSVYLSSILKVISRATSTSTQ